MADTHYGRPAGSAADVQSHVTTRILNHGAEGVRVYPADGGEISVNVIEGIVVVNPTGVGDSFRAGFLAAVGAGLSLERAAQVGCTISAVSTIFFAGGPGSRH